MGNEQSGSTKYGERLNNDISVNWEKISGDNPSSRDGHVAAAIDSKLYVFGGVVRTADGDNVESNDLLAFDLESSNWSLVQAKGDVPAPRSSATMSAVGNQLYVIGGLSQGCGWFDDIHVFNTDTSTWKRVEACGNGPSPRDKLSSVAVGTNIYVFGGFGPKSAEDEYEIISEEDTEDEVEDQHEQEQQGAEFGWFNDLIVFDTESNTWSRPMQMNLGVPSPRAAFGMCAVMNKLFIFGGRDVECRKNDLHIFDTETRKWQTNLEVKGRQPEPRSFHTATSVGSRVIILGGRSQDNQHFNDFHIFDTDSLEWLQPDIRGLAVPTSGLHTATVVKDRLVLFGGSGNFHLDTMQCLDYYNDVFAVKTEDILSGKSLPPQANENQENVPVNVPSEQPIAGQKIAGTQNVSSNGLITQ